MTTYVSNNPVLQARGVDEEVKSDWLNAEWKN